jgi:glycosyltransferase involved in cell wall biosynthesis
MNRKLRIAYMLDNFYPQVNGVVTSSINTAKEMAARGHQIAGVAPYDHQKPEIPEGYFPFPLYLQKGFEAAFYPDFIFTWPFSGKLFRYIRDFKPDIIHFHAPFTIGYQAVRIARKLKIPVVGTFHTFFAEPEYLSIVGLEKFTILSKLGWVYSNLFFNRCQAVVSPSKATADNLMKERLKAPLHVISNGVEQNRFENFRFTGRFPVEIDQESQWILFIGRVSAEKKIDQLIQAMKIINGKNPSVKLLIVGDGPARKKLTRLSEELGLADHIHFSGMIPNKDLLESGVFQKMKLFVTPSTSENQPMTIIEAVSFGLPVIGVNARGVPEMIEGNGMVLEPDNPMLMALSILKVIEDQSLHQIYSRRSLELKARYNIVETTNQMEQLYYHLVDQPAR